MKITFKLTALQIAIATKIVAEVSNRRATVAALETKIKEAKAALKVLQVANEDFEVRQAAVAEVENATWELANHRDSQITGTTGNLHAPWDHGFGLNYCQFLELEGETMRYDGHRCPLIQDGALDVIAEVAGYSTLQDALAFKFAKLEVLAYETSDERLCWYETLAQFESRENENFDKLINHLLDQ